MTDSKPPFTIPTVAEINELPWNGLNVVSTFSGAGGSCLGYRMAGYRVLWANEFVPEAKRTYRANKHPNYGVLDGRDIKEVQASEILDSTGLSIGELDLYDGSPPCQAFSSAGRRESGWGTNKHYEHGAEQKNEELFGEYIRLLQGLKPRVFVAENVTGLARGKAAGFFNDILAELRGSGYVVECRQLDAQYLGVPQQRNRLVFVGCRDDLQVAPAFPSPLPYTYSVNDACPHITKTLYRTGGFWPRKSFAYTPAPAILAGSKNQYFDLSSGDAVPLATADCQRICSFPPDFVFTGTRADAWNRLGNSVPPVMMAHIAATIRDNIFNGGRHNG